MIVAIVAESLGVNVEEMNHLAAKTPIQTVADVDVVLVVARCLVTLILVSEMVKVLNE